MKEVNEETSVGDALKELDAHEVCRYWEVENFDAEKVSYKISDQSRWITYWDGVIRYKGHLFFATFEEGSTERQELDLYPVTWYPAEAVMELTYRPIDELF